MMKLIVGIKGIARTSCALGIKLDKILCHLANRALCLIGSLFPGLAAHFGQLNHSVVSVRAYIFGHEIQLFNGHTKLVTTRILNTDIVTADSVYLELFNAEITTDTVDLVHHNVSHLKLGV